MQRTPSQLPALAGVGIRVMPQAPRATRLARISFFMGVHLQVDFQGADEHRQRTLVEVRKDWKTGTGQEGGFPESGTAPCLGRPLLASPWRGRKGIPMSPPPPAAPPAPG